MLLKITPSDSQENRNKLKQGWGYLDTTEQPKIQLLSFLQVTGLSANNFNQFQMLIFNSLFRFDCSRKNLKVKIQIQSQDYFFYNKLHSVILLNNFSRCTTFHKLHKLFLNKYIR